jgi:DHA1 family inner membrane transport protein
VLARPQVLLGLAITVLGFAGVFAIFTYIQPLLTRLAGLSEAAVSPVLLLMGGGLAVGNILGGKLADRALMPALLGSLVALALVLAAMPLAMATPIGAMFYVALLGVVGFATVAPLQMRVLDKAAGAGQNLASSLNIAAFNLGNALGAWVGGVVIGREPGLAALGWAAALLTVAGVALALVSRGLERRSAAQAPCTAAAA